MDKFKAILSLWGPRIIGLCGFIASVGDMYLHGETTGNIVSAATSAGLALAKGWATTGGTVANPKSAPGTLPAGLIPPK